MIGYRKIAKVTKGTESMKKLYVWMLIGLMLLNSAITYLWPTYIAPVSTDDTNFLIGRWKLQKQLSSEQFLISEMEFVNSNTLFVNFRFQGQNFYNIKFNYAFVNKNKVRMWGQRWLPSEWDVSYHDSFIMIKSTSSPGWPAWLGNVGVFERETNINWPSITWLLGLTVVAAFVAPTPKARTDGQANSQMEPRNKNFFSSAYRFIGPYLLGSIIFTLGLMTGVVLWNLPPLLQVILPWDGVIMMELSIALLIFGIRVIVANLAMIRSVKLSWPSFGGIFIIGVCAYGLIKAMFELITFGLYGHYL